MTQERETIEYLRTEVGRLEATIEEQRERLAEQDRMIDRVLDQQITLRERCAELRAKVAELTEQREAGPEAAEQREQAERERRIAEAEPLLGQAESALRQWQEATGLECEFVVQATDDGGVERVVPVMY